MNYRKIVFTALVSFTSAIAGVYVFNTYFNNAPKIVYTENPAKVQYASLPNTRSAQPIDFRYAASTATPSVVHVKSVIKAEPVVMRGGRDPFRDFFGDDFGQYFHGQNPYQGARVGTGSGVIERRWLHCYE